VVVAVVHILGLLVQVAIPPEQVELVVAVLVAQMEPTEATEQLTQAVEAVLAVEQEIMEQAIIQQRQVAQAAPVSLSSKSHLRTMPHSHLV
jgi:hypothetical protein